HSARRLEDGPDLVTITQECTGTRDHDVAFRKPFDNLDQPPGPEAGLHLAGADFLALQNLHGGPVLSIEQSACRNCQTASVCRLDRAATEAADPQRFITL